MAPWLRIRLVLDRAAAIVITAIASPIIATIAVLVRRNDGGRALIGVDRIGRNHRPFVMWKFRSMKATQPGGSAGGSNLTASGDIRITAIGHKIRRLHLDELPQLVNILRGEMLLIGPRPEAPAFVDPQRHDWSTVLSIPPGIAGAAQVLVEDWEHEFIDHDDDGEQYLREAVPAKLAIDEWYVRSATPVVDLLIAATLAGSYLPLPASDMLMRRVENEVPEAAPIIGWLRERRAEARSSSHPSIRSRRPLSLR